MDQETFKALELVNGDYAVYRYLDISTGHITKKDADALNSNCGIRGAYLIGTYDEGWVLSIGETDDYKGDETFVDCYSPEFYDVLDYARKQGCTLLRFDGDGMEFPNLPSFDW